MLHSSLPRAFLAPGLNYLAYYGDEIHQHPYAAAAAAAATTWHIPLENPASGYSRVPDHHAFHTWDLSRSGTPCPLDLSLKPPPTPRAEDPVDAKKENAGRRGDSGEPSPVVIDDFDAAPRSSSAHSHSSYEQLLSRKEATVEDTRSAFGSPASDVAAKYYDQRLLLASPGQPAQSGYHQQLLLTPQHQGMMQHAPMTPPSTPSPPQCPRRRVREEDGSPASRPADKAPQQRPKKKHARRLKFDEDTSSPVSGTVILGPDEAVVTGDIDPAFNIVEVTDEARAELAKIENRLGPYQCKLCRQLHEDAFQLAQHRCSRIAHVEYRCPECDKRFSCPANLASHRRWHKPRLAETAAPGVEIPCARCDAKFTRQAALRKHLAAQHPEANNNNVALDPQTAGKTDAAQAVPEGPLNAETP